MKKINNPGFQAGLKPEKNDKLEISGAVTAHLCLWFGIFRLFLFSDVVAHLISNRMMQT